MEMLPADSDFVSTLTKKLAPPLVTLLSSEPEASYLSSQINKLASLLALLLFGPIQ